MYRFIIGRSSGDNPVRGYDATVTRIRYQSPPPRLAITQDNDDDGRSSKKLVYGDRGVTGILQTTTYPRSKTLTLLSKAAQDKPPVVLEPRFTPPDCFEAQDDALLKAEILLQETQRAGKRVKRAKVVKSPRRDSAVSEDDEPAPQVDVTATKPQEALATIEPPEQNSVATEPQEAPATSDMPIVHANTEPQIIITTTEPIEPPPHAEDQTRESPKRRKLSPSPRPSSPAQSTPAQPPKSRAESESRFAKPKTPPVTQSVAPAARGESVASVRSTDSKSSRRSRGSRTIKDDLTIDSKFGVDPDDLNEMEYKDGKGKWYIVDGPRPSWAVDERPRNRNVARRSTIGRSNR